METNAAGRKVVRVYSHKVIPSSTIGSYEIELELAQEESLFNKGEMNDFKLSSLSVNEILDLLEYDDLCRKGYHSGDCCDIKLVKGEEKIK